MTAKVERLVNLTVALLETRRPLTYRELRTRTREYQQSNPESARRQFEHDKDDLRALGVPVETVDVAFEEEPGYRIDRTRYELPDVQLEADEVAALALAVKLSGEHGSRLALAKLAARAPDPTTLDATGAPEVEVAVDPIGDRLADALVSHVPLRFEYRTAAGASASRTVDPYAVVRRRGAWYLVARDHDRDAQRAFRLDRVEGELEVAGEPDAFTPPASLDLAAAVAGPESERLEVEVAVAPTARWAVESRGGVPTGETTSDGWSVLQVPGVDRIRDRSWLLGLGDEVEVLAPAELRAEVADTLRAVAGAHGGAA
ncbi:MAG: WYL domain-containing protein [Nitriliruptor sp.]|uniref:helix-turn-helix transcriptional regulator n=1 Tax=Nitriliruptor sp. TaxID=2448056 RepID=UPI00349FDB58